MTSMTDERVLSTLNRDGSRHWIRPRPSPGRFLRARRAVAYLLIALFTLLPYITINGKPAVLLDIIHREFTFFGRTFLPTDTLLLALFMVGLFMTIFLATALFGRVWCGWACPQTVYMEFLYRPIERLLEGTPGRKQKITGATGARKVLKYALYLVCSMFLAHIFIAYFVGVAQLRTWILGSPLEHPVAFLIMATVTALMMFDFSYFREQVCLVACPYGRFQSALLDRKSIIVMYDRNRGEPRGRKKRNGDVSLDVLGDCVDCRLCVTTCPTGIDIRDGLQMECINCAQCIDACDAVMRKVGRTLGLIRYGTQAELEGERKRLLRPRLVIYPTVLALVGALFFAVLLTKGDTDIRVLPRRAGARPFYVLDSGEISNALRVRVVNRSDSPTRYTITTVTPADARLEIEHNPFTLVPGQNAQIEFSVITPFDDFTRGQAECTLLIEDGDELATEIRYLLRGPGTRPAPAPPADTSRTVTEGGEA